MNARRVSRGGVAVAIATSVLALIGAACGQPPRPAGVDPVAQASDDAIAPSLAASVSPDDSQPVGATTPVDAGVVAEAVAVTEPVATGGEVVAPVPGARVLAAAVDPGCAAAGERVTVQVSAMPRASLALAVAFADDQAHGLMAFSEADDGGSFAWSVLIPPDAPAGEAAVLVGARDPADGRDIGTTTTFLVSDGGCR